MEEEMKKDLSEELEDIGGEQTLEETESDDMHGGSSEEPSGEAESGAEAANEAGAGAEESGETESGAEESGEQVSDKKDGFFKKKKKDKRDEQIEDLQDRLKRQMAEFDNFRKRSEREKSQMFDMGAKTIVEKFLPVIDNFERGLAAVTEEQAEDAFVTGMDKVYKQMLTELEAVGVKPIEAAGQVFDPEFHNAVMQVEDESLESGTVAQELQKGYMYRDTVIRHSMVSVVS